MPLRKPGIQAGHLPGMQLRESKDGSPVGAAPGLGRDPQPWSVALLEDGLAVLATACAVYLGPPSTWQILDASHQVLGTLLLSLAEHLCECLIAPVTQTSGKNFMSSAAQVRDGSCLHPLPLPSPHRT